MHNKLFPFFKKLNSGDGRNRGHARGENGSYEDLT